MRVPRASETSTGTRDQGLESDGDEKEGETCSPKWGPGLQSPLGEVVFLRRLRTGRGGWQVFQVEEAAETGVEGGSQVLWEPERIWGGVGRSCKRALEGPVAW